MAMRIGKVDGKPVKRVRKNSNGSTVVQPVRKEVDSVTGIERLVNNGKQFTVGPNKFIKGRL